MQAHSVRSGRIAEHAIVAGFFRIETQSLGDESGPPAHVGVLLTREQLEEHIARCIDLLRDNPCA